MFTNVAGGVNRMLAHCIINLNIAPHQQFTATYLVFNGACVLCRPMRSRFC